jgi:hypothetical protein
MGGSIHDPTDPVDRLLFNVLAMVAEFVSELFGVGRSTVYRTMEQLRPAPPEPERPAANLANEQPPPRA